MTQPAPAVLGLLLAAAASWAAESYPQDVAKYIERRETCEHFREEPWPEGASAEDNERREFIAAQLKRYCYGADRTIRALKTKYRDNRTVLERLERYEHGIEGQR